MGKITPRDNPCYCINFRRAANTLTKFYDKAIGSIGLTINQFSLLNDINLLKSCNKSQLAQYVRLDRTTIIRSLHVLSEKGLIEEVPGVNKRNSVVQLTSTGKTFVKEGFPIWKKAQKEVMSVIGIENIALLHIILTNIELLDES